MSKFERLLEPGSTELLDCRCAAEMNLMAIVPVPGGDSEIRIFRCPDCSHELRLRPGVLAEQLRCGSSPRLILEIDIGERL